MFRPDITVMVGWALKINYLSIYLSIYSNNDYFASANGKGTRTKETPVGSCVGDSGKECQGSG